MRYADTKSRALRWTALLALPLVVGLGACDDDEDDMMQPEDRTFTATLSELNDSDVSGTASFTIDEADDMFTAEVSVAGAPGTSETLHAQHVHFASTCPTAAADANSDGFVDVVEGVPTYGGILVQLDGNVAAYDGNAETFPTGTSFAYSQTSAFSSVLSAHQIEDPDPSDPLRTLGTDGSFDLATRTVVVHGIPADSTLPASVQTIAGLPAPVTLPIACGEVVEN